MFRSPSKNRREAAIGDLRSNRVLGQETGTIEDQSIVDLWSKPLLAQETRQEQGIHDVGVRPRYAT